MKITKLFLSILLLALSLNLQSQEAAESKPIARPGPPVTVAVTEGGTVGGGGGPGPTPPSSPGGPIAVGIQAPGPGR